MHGIHFPVTQIRILQKLHTVNGFSGQSKEQNVAFSQKTRDLTVGYNNGNKHTRKQTKRHRLITHF
jgi:hypothetical protein